MSGGWLSALSYCGNLKTLRLLSCESIDACPGPDEHLGCCPTLEELYLERCQVREKEGVRALFLVCKFVKEISFQDCWGLEDDLFRYAAPCRRVKSISLEGCSLLTTIGLDSVVQNWKELQTLKVVSCNNIQDSEITPELATLFSILKELKWRPNSRSLLAISLSGTGVGKKGDAHHGGQEKMIGYLHAAQGIFVHIATYCSSFLIIMFHIIPLVAFSKMYSPTNVEYYWRLQVVEITLLLKDSDSFTLEQKIRRGCLLQAFAELGVNYGKFDDIASQDALSSSSVSARGIGIAPSYQAFGIAPTSHAPGTPHSIDYLFQFGDSISDTGNLVIESPVRAHNFAAYPYGMTMHKTTGRCSDGLLMIDQFATFFDKPFLNPYLAKGADFSQGVNFAVAGSTALDTPTLQSKGILSPVTPSSLNVQLDWFRTHLETICDNALDCQDILSRSLILIETGGNDYNYAMLEGKTMDQVREMVTEVVEIIINAAKQVISLGATRVYIPGNFPIGCLPIYKATFENDYSFDELRCLDGLNAFARYHNDHLKEAIKELQQEYPEVAVVYGDYYSALSSVLDNADALGFDVPNMFTACCGSGDNDYNFDVTRLCGSQGFEVCADPNQFISWDGIHMTQETYKRMSQWLLPRLVQELNRV
ncbi:hypothetical protein KSS87_009360 [Heliosperma pusillum]|nr:hypothetical protein KSS87_009360 [Heliosperma pusillum]